MSYTCVNLRDGVGLDLLVVGSRHLGDDPRSDVRELRDWWGTPVSG